MNFPATAIAFPMTFFILTVLAHPTSADKTNFDSVMSFILIASALVSAFVAALTW